MSIDSRASPQAWVMAFVNATLLFCYTYRSALEVSGHLYQDDGAERGIQQVGRSGSGSAW